MKAKEFWHLLWKIPQNGYYWEYDGYRPMGESRIVEPPYLVQRDIYDTLIAKTYSDYPPTLFMDFADLSQSKFLEKDILRFANKYGALGEGKELLKKDTELSFEGETISLWENEIWRMKHITDMWNSLNKGDGFYGKHICWIDDKTPVFAIGNYFNSKWDIEKNLKEKGYGRFISPSYKWVEPLPRGIWNYGDLKNPAKFIVAKIVSERLNPERGERLKSRVRPEIYLDESGVFCSSFRPSNLLAFLWVELYEYITGMRKFRYCDICNGLLDVTGHSKAKRVHDKCSNRERQRRFYTKKEQRC